MFKKIKNNVFLRNSVILFVGGMIANALNYVFHLAVGRMVSVEIYGEVESLISFVSIISVPAMALTMLATKYAACSKAENDKKSSRDLLAYLNKKVSLYFFPIFLLALIATPFLKMFLKLDSNIPLILMWISMFVSFYFSITGGILSGWQKFKEASFAGAYGAAAKLIAGIILVKLGFALNGVIGSFLLGGLVSYAASIFALRFIFKKTADEKETGQKENIIDFVSLKGYVLPVFSGNLAIAIFGNVDMVIAKHNFDAVTAGQYGALAIVSKIIFCATGVIATALFSMSAENEHKKNDSIVIFRNAVLMVLAVSLASVVIYFFFPELILGLLFGNKYNEVSGLLGWFAILAAIFSLTNLILQYLLSIHKTKIVYSLCFIAFLMPLTMLFLGGSISAILLISALFQIAAIAVGLVYLLKNRIHKKQIL